MVTIFRNINDTSTPFNIDIHKVFDRIRVGKYKDIIQSIRKEKDKTTRNNMKKQLPAICFSGEFTKRSDDGIKNHSGYICLDFDGYKTKKEMNEFRDYLTSDAYVMAVFVSPSGLGLKVIVKIPKDSENHKRYFDALKDYFNTDNFDTTSKNISRVCYESYDPNIHVNDDSELWDKMAEIEYQSMPSTSSHLTIPVSDEKRIVDITVGWWSKKYPMINGQRNNNIFILASAFNEYGVSKSLAEYVISQYQTSDFTASEIKTTIDSAYRDSSKFRSKFYEDRDRVSSIRMMVSRGDSSPDILRAMPDLDENVAKSVIKDAEKAFKKFWTKSEKGKIDVVHYLFKQFLQDNGYYKYFPHKSKKNIFVKVTDNLIDDVKDDEIKGFVLRYLESLEDMSVYNYFADKTRFFKDDFLSLLDTVDIHFVRDTKDFSFIYFNNCALMVYKDKIEQVDYVDLGGYVWRDQVINRDFTLSKGFESCDFAKFISNISDNNKNRFMSLRTTIGFLMSGYKDPGFCPAVILNDEVITDNPEGGTGKGLFVQGLSQLKKVSPIDGKLHSFDGEFAYQTIDTDTQIISFDDVQKGFKFERLFSAITEGLTIRKLYEAAVRIPFKDSPKIIITTNYAISGKGNSFDRRKWELEFKQHYNENYKPIDDFGKRLFDEWDDNEWLMFDNFMISNLQLYLEHGLYKAEFKNINIRKLGAETCHEFIEWAGVIDNAKRPDLIRFDTRIFYYDLYLDFVSLNSDFSKGGKMSISGIRFNKWVDAYASYLKSIGYISSYEYDKAGKGKWLRMIKDGQEVSIDEADPEFEF